MSRGTPIGGIYSRPVVIGYLIHFLTAALAILEAIAPSFSSGNLWGIAAPYALFAIAFGIVLFRHPVAVSDVDVKPAARTR